jgi:hypothetical protein
MRNIHPIGLPLAVIDKRAEMAAHTGRQGLQNR